MNRGDIILIPFPFTDLLGNKKGHALILVNGQIDVTVVFVSTQLTPHILNVGIH